jgi:hypothetical protein
MVSPAFEGGWRYGGAMDVQRFAGHSFEIGPDIDCAASIIGGDGVAQAGHQEMLHRRFTVNPYL